MPRGRWIKTHPEREVLLERWSKHNEHYHPCCRQAFQKNEEPQRIGSWPPPQMPQAGSQGHSTEERRAGTDDGRILASEPNRECLHPKDLETESRSSGKKREENCGLPVHPQSDHVHWAVVESAGVAFLMV